VYCTVLEIVVVGVCGSRTLSCGFWLVSEIWQEIVGSRR